MGLAAFYVLGSVVLSIAGLFIGLWIITAIWHSADQSCGKIRSRLASMHQAHSSPRAGVAQYFDQSFQRLG